jgi:hypothetical protein
VLGGLEMYITDDNNTAKSCVLATRTDDLGPEHYATSHLLPLTATCSQIHSETRLLPYNLNKFTGFTDHVIPFLIGSLNGPDLRFVTNIRIFIAPTDIEDRGSTLKLRGGLVNMMLVMTRIAGLKKLTLEWTARSNIRDWDKILGVLRQEGQQIFGNSLKFYVEGLHD